MKESLLLEDQHPSSLGGNGYGTTLVDPEANTTPPHNHEFIHHKTEENVGLRLAMRSGLMKSRKSLADACAIFALLGFILAFLESELFMDGVFGEAGKRSLASILMKSAVSGSTALLLIFIIAYHSVDVKIFLVDNSIDHWSLAMTARRVVTMTMEMILCAVHPIPGDHEYDREGAHVPVDVILTLVMSTRVYLLSRVLLYHSRLFQDTSAQSLGSLNKISLNIRFVFKSMMHRYPEYVMITLITVLFLWASWAMRACEMYHPSPMGGNIFNSMWLVAITFLTIGYGDITPASYCGRTVSVMTGIFGAGCTALTVATLARKLELSSAEKYVQQFVIDVELSKKMKHCAANIMKESWLVFKYRRHAGTLEKARLHQRRLMQCLRDMKNMKEESRTLKDSNICLHEIHLAQHNFQRSLDAMMSHLQRMSRMWEEQITAAQQIPRLQS